MLALFAEIDDLFHSCNSKYNERINYIEFYKFINSKDSIFRAFAYGITPDSGPFQKVLKYVGFEVRWDFTYIEFTLDVVRTLDRVDKVVLASGNKLLLPLITWIKEQGVPVIIVGCNICKDVKSIADETIELPKSILNI